MKNVFNTTIETQPNCKKIKGKCLPIQTHTGVEPIQQIFTFDSSRKNFPYIFIVTKTHYYLGITLARQSSDFLVNLAKKIISEKKITKINLMQYMLPKDISSLKLIIFRELIQEVDFNSTQKELTDIQTQFTEKQQKIIDLVKLGPD
jgi:hypothetical protein